MVNHLVFSLIGVESFGVLEAGCVPTGIRVVLFAMTTRNPQEHNRMEKTEQVLAALLDGQAKILEMGSKTGDNFKR